MTAFVLLDKENCYSSSNQKEHNIDCHANHHVHQVCLTINFYQHYGKRGQTFRTLPMENTVLFSYLDKDFRCSSLFPPYLSCDTECHHEQHSLRLSLFSASRQNRMIWSIFPTDPTSSTDSQLQIITLNDFNLKLRYFPTWTRSFVAGLVAFN